MLHKNILKIALILSAFFPILFGSLFFVSFDQNFYEQEFEKYALYDQFAENQTIINQEFSSLLNYLKNPSEGLTSTFYNEREKLHLQDVKRLYFYAEVILLLSFITFIFTSFYFSKKDFKTYLTSLQIASVLVILFFILLFIFIYLDFQTTFIFFHKILFTNELWLLNPETDNLIKLLPLEVFLDLSKRFFSIALGLSVFILLITSLLKRSLRKNFHTGSNRLS